MLNSFQPTTEDKLKEIIEEFGIKTSSEDPIAAKVLQSVINVALPCLSKLVNKSFHQGFHGRSETFGYRRYVDTMTTPVNNLVFFSKLIGHIVLKRLDSHVSYCIYYTVIISLGTRNIIAWKLWNC